MERSAKGLSRSALIRALRRQGDEAQFTQAVRAVCEADPEFARAFVELVLSVASTELGSERARVLLAAGVPEGLKCRAEHQVDGDEGSRGRVDLRFDARDFTLLVENKLHSGYGVTQLRRYIAATNALNVGRSGLVSITRNLPAYGEEELANEPAWVGSVRWAKLLRAGMGRLPIRDPKLRGEWATLLEVMKEDGDLGSLEADSELIRSWASYRKARAHLADLLDQIRETALSDLQKMLKAAHRTGVPSRSLAGMYVRGAKDQIVIQHEQRNTYVAFRVPRNVQDWNVGFGFTVRDDSPCFWVSVCPWDAEGRMPKDRQLTGAIEALELQGFEADGDYWTRFWAEDKFIDEPDVPGSLSILVREAFERKASSKVLKFDIEETVARSRRGPKRKRGVKL